MSGGGGRAVPVRACEEWFSVAIAMALQLLRVDFFFGFLTIPPLPNKKPVGQLYISRPPWSLGDLGRRESGRGKTSNEH